MGWVGPLEGPSQPASQGSQRWSSPGRGGLLGPGCGLPSSSSVVLAAPTLPSRLRPRPDTCSHTQACQGWPCSLQTGPCLPPRSHAPWGTHRGLQPSTHHPLALFYDHSCTRSHAHLHHLHLPRDPDSGPGPPPLWASSPLGSMNNSLLSLWASNIYPLRFPALCSLGEGPALAPPSLSPHPLRVWGHFSTGLTLSRSRGSRDVCLLESEERSQVLGSLLCACGEDEPGWELPTPAARADCLLELEMAHHPAPRVLTAGVTQTSVTSGATRPCTWQLPMATCTASPSWCPSGPTSGAWTTTTTHHWTWPP